MLRSLALRTKLLALIGILLSGILLISILGISNVDRMRRAAVDMHDRGFQPTEQTSRLLQHLYKLRGNVYKLLLLPDEAVKVTTDITKDLALIDSVLANLKSMESDMVDSTIRAGDSVRAALEEYRAAIGEITAHAANGDVEFGKLSLKSGTAHHARAHVDKATKPLFDGLAAEVSRIDENATRSGRSAFLTLLTSSTILLLVGILGSLYLISEILKPFREMMVALDKLGDGDFREEASQNMAKPAEVLRMEASLARARTRLREAILVVSASASSTLETSVEQMQTTEKLSSEADANEREAHSAASATEEAATTFKTIAAGATQSMASLVSVSAAIEEMTASVSEIAHNADQTRAMTQHALQGARSASKRMEELSAASKEIETVIGMIVDISEQTKLLALNATIEAARAGEAGKGFAVVAGEVKELAKGTAVATEDIRRRVEAIRSTTTNAVGEIATVSDSMATLGQNISSIAGAVEEQSATTREISRNIGEAVQGTREIHRNLDAGAAAVSEIARDIQKVLERGRALREVAVTTSGLSKRSEDASQKLAAEVRKFKT